MAENKRGQMKLSFGMIFSIILINFFLAFAFYAIQKFLSLQDEIKTAKFYESLRADVERVWTSTEASKEVQYIVPNNVKQVCFKSDPNKNVYFKTDRPKPGEFVEHLKILEDACFPAYGGKVKFTLEKEYGEALVSVKP
ncbi:MAG: hypothetical protein Q8Q04_02600 [archaeon]|nr:hypothetical protein [archaeon]